MMTFTMPCDCRITFLHVIARDCFLTTLVLVFALQCWVCVSDVLPAVATLRTGKIACAGVSIPGAVGVSCQAALGTCFTVHAAAMQWHLRHTCIRAYIQLLLQREKKESKKVNKTGGGWVTQNNCYITKTHKDTLVWKSNKLHILSDFNDIFYLEP